MPSTDKYTAKIDLGQAQPNGNGHTDIEDEFVCPKDRLSPELDRDLGSPDDFTVSNDFTSTVGSKKVVLRMNARKPSKEQFVRVRPGSEWSQEVSLIQFKEDPELRHPYIVTRAVQEQIVGEPLMQTYILRLGITRLRDLFIWPLRKPDPNRECMWHDSAIEISYLAERSWLKVLSNQVEGFYEPKDCGKLIIPDPVWPEDKTFSQLRDLAFKNRVIRSMDHEIIQNLGY